jgi:hypothetical protein
VVEQHKAKEDGEQGRKKQAKLISFLLIAFLHTTSNQQEKKAEECFLAKHPEAKWWLPGAGFHDFKWYNLEIEEIYYIGGFGGIHYIGWIDVDTYYSATANSNSARLTTIEDMSGPSGSFFRQQTRLA